MKIRPLLEKLTDKWPAKAICVVAACVLYMFNQYTSLERKSIPVSLEVVQDGEMICTTRIPSSVSVTIQTSDSNITQVSSEGIVATLDLSYITREGNFDVPVYVDLPPKLKDLEPLQVTVLPSKINVHLEKNISRFVKVVPSAVGETPYGYVVKSFSAEPEYVEIFGPRSIVESVNSLETEAIVIDGKTATFSEQKRLVNHDRLVKLGEVEEVAITANIDYATGDRSFYKMPVVLKNLNPDFETDDVFFADFSISGTQLALDEYEPVSDVLFANLGSVTEIGTYEIPVNVLIPREFRLENISVETISINVREKIPVIPEDDLEETEVFSE